MTGQEDTTQVPTQGTGAPARAAATQDIGGPPVEAQRPVSQLYPMQGEPRVVWAADARRWDSDSAYREAVVAFVSRYIVGAKLDSAKVLQDDGGMLVMGAWTFTHADGSFRHDSAGRVVAQPVVVPLPDAVELPR